MQAEQNQQQDISLALIRLFRGVVEKSRHPGIWRTLEKNGPQLEERIGAFGLDLCVDEADGYAYLRQRETGSDGTDLPRLVRQRSLSFPVSLLLVLLRKRLLEHDAAGRDSRLILSREEIIDMMRVFMPDSTNEARIIDRIDSHIEKVCRLGFLHELRGHKGNFEVHRIIRAFVDMNWLASIDEKLQVYAEQLEEGTDE